MSKRYRGTGWTDVEINLPSVGAMMSDLGLEPQGRAQQKLTGIVLRRVIRYLPGKSGMLAGLTRAQTDLKAGLVITKHPAAHYLHEGEVYGPNIPIKNADGLVTGWFSPPGMEKEPTGRKLKYNRDLHDKAGPHWGDRMAAAEGDEIAAEMEAYLNKKGGT